MVKWDTHTHTQFCKHGSGDETALMVEKAIGLGFTRYSISEHAPLPEEFMPDPDQRSEFSLLHNQIDDYFSFLNDLKKVYGNRIEILSGMEMDYLDGFEDYTIDFINTYLNELDDLIISLHFIEGNGGLRSFDYTPDDFKDGLLDYYGSIDLVYTHYWQTIKKLLAIDFGFSKAKRIGHIGLINKFSNRFPWVSDDLTGSDFLKDTFTLVKSNGWTVEFNAAGMTKGYNGNAYLTKPMLYWCKKLNLDICYGSDAHGFESVGKYYTDYLGIMR